MIKRGKKLTEHGSRESSAHEIIDFRICSVKRVKLSLETYLPWLLLLKEQKNVMCKMAIFKPKKISFLILNEL